VDVGSDILLLSELKILTPNFELTLGTKILWISFFSWKGLIWQRIGTVDRRLLNAVMNFGVS